MWFYHLFLIQFCLLRQILIIIPQVALGLRKKSVQGSVNLSEFNLHIKTSSLDNLFELLICMIISFSLFYVRKLHDMRYEIDMRNDI